MRCFLSFLFLLLWVPVPAQDIVRVSDARNVVNLAFDAEYIEDSACQLSIQQIMQPENSLPWQRLGKYAANFGITSSAFWLKTKLQNTSGAPLLVRLNLHALNDVMLYETKDGRIVNEYRSGDRVPFEKRVIRSTDFLFPLAVPQDSSTTVYLRVRHNRGTEFT
ncbi:MAG TPA: 7TM-DISM domain-containing protein, partial [Flavisolibacter sp.]|nr:7TM-DISM domain-containing protein [Flavisolibacter sp.]